MYKPRTSLRVHTVHHAQKAVLISSSTSDYHNIRYYNIPVNPMTNSQASPFGCNCRKLFYLHRQLCHWDKIRMGLHSQAGKSHGPLKQCCLQSKHIKPDNGGGSCHTCSSVARLKKRWPQNPCSHHHRLHEHAAEDQGRFDLLRVGNLPQRHTAGQNHRDVLPWSCRGQGQWTGKQTGQYSWHQTRADTWHIRGATCVQKEFASLRDTRTPQHWTPPGERSTQREWSLVNPERQGKGNP